MSMHGAFLKTSGLTCRNPCPLCGLGFRYNSPKVRSMFNFSCSDDSVGTKSRRHHSELGEENYVSHTSTGGRLSIAAVLSAVMLAGTMTPATATPTEAPDQPQSTQSPAPSDTPTPPDQHDSQSEEPQPASESDEPSSPAEETATGTPSATPEPTSSPTTDEEPTDDVESEASTSAEQQQDVKELVHETFDNDALPEGWDGLVGDWRVEDGRLLGTSTGGGQARIVFGKHYDHYRFEATIRFDDAVNDARWMAFGLDMPTDTS